MRFAPTVFILVALHVVACGSDSSQELPQRKAGPVQGAAGKEGSANQVGIRPNGNGNGANGSNAQNATGPSSVVDPYKPGTAPQTGGGATSPGASGSGADGVLVPTQPNPSQGLWKGLLMTGDHSINAFDNARNKLTELFTGKGVKAENLKQLSMRDGGVDKTSRDTIKSSLAGLGLGASDRCLVHMTSHGSREGFYLAGDETLSPEELDEMLTEACGERPTVVLVSACYSGVFSDSAAMKKPNRIILTAARADRTSFGCGTENEYTYWDGCLVENFPQATTWKGLYDSVKSCITRKEAGGFTPSEPQAYFGASVDQLGIFN